MFSLVVVVSIIGSLACKLFNSIFILISELKVFISVVVVVWVSIIGSVVWKVLVSIFVVSCKALILKDGVDSVVWKAEASKFVPFQHWLLSKHLYLYFH